MVWNKGLKGYNAGSKSSFWKGGLTSKDQTLRSRIEFREWRRKVFTKNINKCNVCNSTKYLIAHHLKSFNDYPKLRYDVKNAIILCRKCHPGVHRWGLKQMKDWGGSVITKKCITCNKSFTVSLYRRNAKFCSKECFYNKPDKQTHEQKLEWRRQWYKKNILKKLTLKQDLAEMLMPISELREMLSV